MRFRGLLVIFMTTAILFTATACNEDDSQTNKVKEVGISIVALEKGMERSELSGTLQAVEEVTASFEVSGKVKSINVQEGSNVNIGDVIASLDEESYKLQVNAAEANVLNASAALSQISNGARAQEIAIAKSNLDQATVAYQKASDDFKRYEELFKAGAISKSQYEAYKTQLTVSEKGMLSAQESYSLTSEGARKEERARAAATYGSATTSKDQAELSLSKTQLKSTISGTIISKNVTKDQMVVAGTEMFKIANIKSLKVVLPVPDYEISKWKVGDKVTTELYEGTREGTVTKIFPAVSQGTGTIGVEVIIDNKGSDWRPGQVVTCLHMFEGNDVIYAPVDAVISSGSEAYVFIVEGDKVIKTPIKQGNLKGDKIEICSGLKPGSKVVSKGADRLFDNDMIKAIGG